MIPGRCNPCALLVRDDLFATVTNRLFSIILSGFIEGLQATVTTSEAGPNVVMLDFHVILPQAFHDAFCSLPHKGLRFCLGKRKTPSLNL
jgi:hypothetical protein